MVASTLLPCPLLISFSYRLGRWMAFASVVSIFGQFSAGLAPTARVIWAMANGTDGSPQYLFEFIGAALPCSSL